MASAFVNPGGKVCLVNRRRAEASVEGMVFAQMGHVIVRRGGVVKVVVVCMAVQGMELAVLMDASVTWAGLDPHARLGSVPR